MLSKEVWITAITIALVASLESLLSIEAIDSLDPYKRVTPTNRELKAQGISNLISGFLGGLPITSVIVRSSANLNSGAKTRMSAILHGLLIFLFVLFFAKLLNIIPIACMAAILIHTGYKLAKPSLFKDYFAKGWEQFLPMVITVASILLTDLLKGVLIGIVSGLFFVIRSNFHTAIFVLQDKNQFLFRLRKDVSFLNKPILKKKLEEVPADSFVIIDLSKADYIDFDIRAVIDDFSKHAMLKNIQLEIVDRN
jgi:MFS superfamily sulfate permease-like transporter